MAKKSGGAPPAKAVRKKSPAKIAAAADFTLPVAAEAFPIVGIGASAGGLEALTTKDPLTLFAYQYDLVCNGYEIASGAIRSSGLVTPW